MAVILFLIGFALSADGLYCGYMDAMGAGEAIIVGFGVVLILMSCFYRSFRERGFLRFIKRLVTFALVVLLVYSAAICAIGTLDNATWHEDYVIVLGSKVNGGEPTELLKTRLDKAVEYMNTNSNATAVVTGGQGQDEPVSEALVMYNYLVENGIDGNRIYIEDTATSTYENFASSAPAVADGNVVFITNEFHIVRSAQMARLNGLDASHISAKTPLAMLPCKCAREAVAQIAALGYYFGWR